MAYTIKKEDIITYPPETLRTFKVVMYEWINDLNFTLKPEECLSNPEEYQYSKRTVFKRRLGW